MKFVITESFHIIQNDNFDKMDNLDRHKVFLVQEWVRKICGPEYGNHHGYEHAETVSNLAFMIYSEMVSFSEIDDELENFVRIVGYLHDVPYTKIDKDGSKKRALEKFLQENLPQQHKLVIEIIDRISYKKELDGEIDWTTVLGKTGKLIRDIIYDADRLQMLGPEGLNRAIEQTTQHLDLTDSVDDQKRCFTEVSKTVELKLKNLHENLCTEPGKKLGKERTITLLTAHEKWQTELFN